MNCRHNNLIRHDYHGETWWQCDEGCDFIFRLSTTAGPRLEPKACGHFLCSCKPPDLQPANRDGITAEAPDTKRGKRQIEAPQDFLQNVPRQYKQRASYDFIDGAFKVCAGGYGLAECEDSEVAHAICMMWNEELRKTDVNFLTASHANGDSEG